MYANLTHTTNAMEWLRCYQHHTLRNLGVKWHRQSWKGQNHINFNELISKYVFVKINNFMQCLKEYGTLDCEADVRTS